jgi:hypothetical protein
VLKGNAQTLSIFVSTGGSDANNGSATFPIQTLEKVRSMLEDTSLISGKEVEVVFGPGSYFISRTFELQAKKFKGKSLVFRAEKQGTVEISGGKVLKGWKKDGKGIWSVPWDGPSPEQLFADDQWAERARTPNFSEEKPFFSIQKINISSYVSGIPEKIEVETPVRLKAIDSSEVCEIVILKDWATYRKQVQSISTTENKVLLKGPFSTFKKGNGIHNTLTNPERVKGFMFHLEGGLSMLDQPGEWAYYNGRIYYLPKNNINPNQLEMVVPVVQTLFSIFGTREKTLENIRFQGINFQHTGYYLPEIGHDGGQAATFYGGEIQGFYKGWLSPALECAFVHKAGFSNCTFKNLGGNGLRLNAGCKNIRVDSCSFSNIGGNGLSVGTIKDMKEDTLAQVHHISIAHNSITRVGCHFPSAVGIWLGFAHHCQVLENQLFDLPYTGISVGWQWNPEPTSASNNKIIGNHVYRVMKELGDGGGIYVLGFQPGSEIIENQIHDVERSKYNNGSPNNGLYFDEGSKGYYACRNRIYRISHAPVRGHRAAGVVLEENELYYEDPSPVYHSPPYGTEIKIYEDGEYFWNWNKGIGGYAFTNPVQAFTLIWNKMVKGQPETSKQK